MGIVDNIKDLYFSVEDKYYSVLDNLNNYIPIYKVVDPIDSVFPSLLAILIVTVIGLGAIFLLPVLTIQQGVVNVLLEDDAGNPLANVEITFISGDLTGTVLTDSSGKALLILPAGEEAKLRIKTLTIGGTEFLPFEDTVLVSTGAQEKLIKLKRSLPDIIERTLVFQYTNGERISSKPIRVRLACSSGITPVPPEVIDEDRDGTITVQEPPGCGVMQATVLEPVEFAGDVYLLDKSIVTLRLQEEETAIGSLRVKIKDKQGKLLDTVSFKVSLFDADGLKEQEKFTQFYGETIFRDIVQGTYSVGVQDTAGNYAIATEENIRISVDETESVNVVVSKSIKGTLEITAVDADSGAEIADAAIRLVGADGKTVAESKTGEAGEPVIFPIEEDDDYILYSVHDDYLYGELDLAGEIDGVIELEMEKMTAENSGRINVRVFDEDEVPVENAKVKLRFLENDFLAPYDAEITDFNGNAEFIGVKEESYYIYVEKFPSSGDNKLDGKKIDIRTVTDFVVELFIGETTVNVAAVDEEGQSVAESDVEFFSITGTSLGKIPLTDGTASYSLKADKKVYAVIKHPNFQTVHTMPKQLYPETTVNFLAELEPRLISGEPKIDFVGAFTPSMQPAGSLNAGQRYILKFKLAVPETDGYDRGGAHFRVGNESLLANDPLVIKDLIAGNVSSVLKGSTFTSPTGYSVDFENRVKGDAKWVNFEWDDIEAANYFFGIEVRVKSQITPQTMLPMHYRAWTEVDDAIERDPYDSTLGVEESSSQKQALYAKSYFLEYYEGELAECDEDFCYSGEWILDEEEGLYIYAPYEARVNSPHVFNFIISNNSSTVYSDSELSIIGLDETFLITEYEIQDADARTITAENIRVRTVDEISLGNFTKGKTVNAKLKFKPTELGSDSFEIKVVADGKIVFQKIVSIRAVSEKNMAIEVQPLVVPSFVATPMDVTIYELVDGGQKFELQNAIVSITKSAYNRTEQSWTDTTNSLGKASFTIPASSAGTKITIRAEKPGYAAEPIELFVDANVLLFSPEQITSNLSTKDEPEANKFIEITNIIPSELELTRTNISGRFKGLLDEATMANYLGQFQGTTIEGNEVREVELVKVKLSENASEILRKAEKLEGSVWLTFENKDAGAVYDFIIPLKVNVTISGLPETEDCVVITKSKWETTTQGNAAVLEFEVQNNCMSKGKFLPLDRLVAKIDWQSDIMGNVELSLQDALSAESNIETLKPIVWSRMFEDVREEGLYYGLLTFTPLQGYLGQDAEFQVSIDGEMFTGEGTGYQKVGSSPSYIDSSIKIMNLESCVTYEGAESVVLVPGVENGSTTFVVDASNCGNTTIDFSLCRNDTGCSGGAEGGINVMPQKFSTTPTNPVQEITVMRQTIPGLYGVWVSARTPGRSFKKVKLLDVFVDMSEHDIFSLDKYEFNIKGQGNKDTAQLKNKSLSEMVTVDASACAWGMAEEQEEELFNLAGAGVGAAIGGIMGAQQALKAGQGAQKAAESVDDQAITDGGDAATKAGDAASKAAEASQTAVDSADKAVEAAEKAKETADATQKASKALETGKAAQVDTVCQAGGAVTGAAQSLTAATEGIQQATDAALDNTQDFADTAQDGLDKATEAQDMAGEAQNNYSQGQKNATPKSAGEKPPNLDAAASFFDTSGGSGGFLGFGKSGFKGSGKLAGQASDTMTDATKQGQEIITDDLGKKIPEEIASTEAEIDALTTAMNAARPPCLARSCAPGTCCPPKCVPTCPGAACEAAIDEAIVELQAFKTEQLAEMEAENEAMKTAMGSAKDTIKDTISDQLKNSIKGIDDAVPAVKNALKAAKAASKAAEGMAMASSMQKGDFWAITGTFAALGALAGGLLGGLFGADDDPCAQRVQQPLVDYIINLKEDALPLTIDRQGIAGTWNTEDAKVFGTWERQDVAVVFENTALEESEPVYGTTAFSATKHNHANPTIIPGDDGDFGPFNVPDISAETFTQRIHLKFNTKTIIDKIPPYRPESGCLQGTMFGTTGYDALPRVKLSWAWNEVSGITNESCLAENPNGIYCDATQFGIMLTKRIKILEDFLKENPVITCPDNPAMLVLEQIQAPMETHEVPSGTMGLSAIEKSVAGTTAAVAVKIENNSGFDKSGDIEIYLVAPGGISLSAGQQTCTQAAFVPAGSTETVSCGFVDLPESSGYYSARAKLISEDTINRNDVNSEVPEYFDAEYQDRTSSLTVSFLIPGTQEEGTCWLPYSTRLFDGKPALEYYLEEMDEFGEVVWTDEIQNLNDFRDYVQFKVSLMEDGYSTDFQSDFVDYYDEIAFMDAPEWFVSRGDGAFIDYFGDTSRMHFVRRYVNSTKLSNAGKYDILLKIDFENKDFTLFDTSGDPTAEIEISMYIAEEPFPNSIFYYLPFNGELGKTTSNGRVGYGLDYINAGDAFTVNSDDGILVNTEEISGSTTVSTLNTDTVFGFKNINSLASNRGMLLKIKRGSSYNENDLLFYPHYATPVMMVINKGSTDEPFSAFFELLDVDQPQEVGSSLSFWTGAGQCLDFTGIPVFEKFSNTPDREGVSGDPLAVWQYAYALDWKDAERSGDVYLKTYIYTPTNGSFALKGIAPEGLAFLTPDSALASSVELKGISTMNNNSKSARDSVAELQDLFELVEAGDVCVTDTGSETSFWWNPKTLYEMVGSYSSLSEIEEGLAADQTCIGYGS